MEKGQFCDVGEKTYCAMSVTVSFCVSMFLSPCRDSGSRIAVVRQSCSWPSSTSALSKPAPIICIPGEI